LEHNLFRYVWRNSKRDQLIVLAMIVLSLPFYFAAFDLPKRIINDALQGRVFAGGNTSTSFLNLSLTLPEALGGTYTLFNGFQVNQLQLLFSLSTVFLLLVIINGAFKYYINLSKGILGERMLRRMRFEVFALYLRFKPEDIKGVKPAEAASIIKDEIEPIGGFTGDAFIQPAFLGMQAFTALLFIMVQSFWLGLVTLSVVMVQGFIIPGLRREQLRLARLRQIESRRLAGRIGEVIEIAPSIHATGSASYVRADLANRLGVLFKIRADLFRRKFAVKYLNNFLAQVTPFFFYSFGGYLALTGAMNIGQLVAVIAAYRDLPPPIKELLDWDQERADVTVKYQQIVAQFPSRLLSQDNDDPKRLPPPTDAPLRISSLQVSDRRGATILAPMTVDIARPSHVALLGAVGSGREGLARVIGRQAAEFKGNVTCGDVDWRQLPDSLAITFLSYVGPDPLLFAGDLRDNVVVSLLRRPPQPFAEPLDGADRDEHVRRMEALRTGNPAAIAGPEWLDFEVAGAKDASDLDGIIMARLATVGLSEDVYRFGLMGKLTPAEDPAVMARFPAARERILGNLAAMGLGHVVEPLDPARYNHNATVSENLLFGLPLSERFANDALGSDNYVRSILEAEALLFPLAQIGLRMAETAIEVFADLPPGHPFFERFSFISSEDMPEFKRLVEKVEALGTLSRLSTQEQSRLIGLAMSYIEPRHRMDVLTPAFERRVLRTRRSLQEYLPADYAGDIEFYDPSRYLHAASIQDNLLFGRITYGLANAEAQVRAVIRQTLEELDLQRVVNRIGLGYDVGPGGKLLSIQQRAAVGLARSLITRPHILLLDGALSVFGQGEARRILASLRSAMTGFTLLVTVSVPEEAEGFDQVIAFDGPRHLNGFDQDAAPDDSPSVSSPVGNAVTAS
jgi:putative ABC transport system ATP-binding protein